MPDNRRAIIELLNDPICLLLMKRDGVCSHDVLELMQTVRPLVGRPSRHHAGCHARRIP